MGFAGRIMVTAEQGLFAGADRPSRIAGRLRSIFRAIYLENWESGQSVRLLEAPQPGEPLTFKFGIIPFWSVADGRPVPVAAAGWNESQWSRFRQTHELLHEWDEVRAAAKSRGETAAQALSAFNEQRGEFWRSQNLSTVRSALDRYRQRLNPTSGRFDGNVDGRGRPGRRKGARRP